jgi:dienelactone hydrolase
MLKILIGLVTFVLVGCASSVPVTLNDSSKPRVSIYRLHTHPKQVPTVIVSHGSAGVDAHILDVADRIKSWGYNIVVVDHYSEKGIASGYHNVGTVIKGATGPERALDVIAAARWIKKQPWHRFIFSSVASNRLKKLMPYV